MGAREGRCRSRSPRSGIGRCRPDGTTPPHVPLPHRSPRLPSVLLDSPCRMASLHCSRPICGAHHSSAMWPTQRWTASSTDMHKIPQELPIAVRAAPVPDLPTNSAPSDGRWTACSSAIATAHQPHEACSRRFAHDGATSARCCSGRRQRGLGGGLPRQRGRAQVIGAGGRAAARGTKSGLSREAYKIGGCLGL
ncbi:hypothetical protein B0H10DRAFT_153029 [Mycena sp. CBHHK59/15]|nr:hypothetical protein B0H10DRAFT_153029 [Mycena sp. CBHHK59/15]